MSYAHFLMVALSHLSESLGVSVCSSGLGSLADLHFLQGVCSHGTVGQLDVVEVFFVG